jgi:cold shock CspA family protein
MEDARIKWQKIERAYEKICSLLEGQEEEFEITPEERKQVH